jgi:hypothetical protein
MRVTAIYNKANDISYLKQLAENLEVEADDRLVELEEVLSKL